MGLATYSNSKPTVLSYASIFESLWKQTELYERLQEVDKAKDEFINIAAHELRTPIQPIIGLSDVLHSKIKDFEQREFLDIIIRNARRLQQLTEDVLDVTRIESRNLKLRKERVSLNEIILNTISDYRNQIVKENKNNTLKLEFVNLTDKSKDIIIEADKSRISQVISNLLSNAIKFTNEGTIIVSTERNANDVLVSIRDTGTGIDSDVLPQLFTKFTTKSTTGTGLGLFISKSIVEAHDGRIWAENNKDGKGATFYFRIPISK
jgi:signal transduction histidine kinase